MSARLAFCEIEVSDINFYIRIRLSLAKTQIIKTPELATIPPMLGLAALDKPFRCDVLSEHESRDKGNSSVSDSCDDLEVFFST